MMNPPAADPVNAGIIRNLIPDAAKDAGLIVVTHEIFDAFPGIRFMFLKMARSFSMVAEMHFYIPRFRSFGNF